MGAILGRHIPLKNLARTRKNDETHTEIENPSDPDLSKPLFQSPNFWSGVPERHWSSLRHHSPLGVNTPPNFDEHFFSSSGYAPGGGAICYAMYFIGIFPCCIQLKVFPGPPPCNELD